MSKDLEEAHNALKMADAALFDACRAFARGGDRTRELRAEHLMWEVRAEDPQTQDRVWRCLEPDRGMRPEQVAHILAMPERLVFATLSTLCYPHGLVRQRGGWYRSRGERAPSSYGPGEGL